MDFDFENQLQCNQNANQDGYYQQYCRLFLANIALTNQIKQLVQQKNHLKYRLSKYQDQQCFSSFQRNQKAKRFRRNAHQIQRFYKCIIRSCAKSYGSEGSLNQHYKLKHPEIYATLPNVQSTTCGTKSQNYQNQVKQQQKSFIRDSNSKVSSILKELGDMKSFKSIKIEELKFENQQNKQNKQNKCQNIGAGLKNQNIKQKFQQKQFLNIFKREQSILIDDGNQKLKRSCRTIKKRDFNY